MPILQSLHFSGPLPALNRPGSHFLHGDVWTAPSSGHVAADPPPPVGSAPFSHDVHGSQEPLPMWRGHKRKSNDSPTIDLDAVPPVIQGAVVVPPVTPPQRAASCMHAAQHTCMLAPGGHTDLRRSGICPLRKACTWRSLLRLWPCRRDTQSISGWWSGCSHHQTARIRPRTSDSPHIWPGLCEQRMRCDRVGTTLSELPNSSGLAQSLWAEGEVRQPPSISSRPQ